MIYKNNLEILHMDYNTYRQELLALHKQVINAHLEKDVAFFTRNIADDYFSVSLGELNRPSKEEISQMFTHYFASTDFKEYRDIMDPIVKVSDDGTLGWIVVQVKIIAEMQIEDKIHKIDDVWTWITLYKRENDIWIRMGEVASSKSQ